MTTKWFDPGPEPELTIVGDKLEAPMHIYGTREKKWRGAPFRAPALQCSGNPLVCPACLPMLTARLKAARLHGATVALIDAAARCGS